MAPEEGSARIVLSRREGVAVLDVDDGTSLYHADMDNALVLNATASDIWQLCDGTHTLDDIVGLLAGAYGVPGEQIRPEVESSVRVLRDEGFLLVEGQTP